jgi:hypothetical protein
MHHTVSQLMTASPPKDAKFRFLKWDAALLIQRECNYYQRIADPKNIFIVYESAAIVPLVWTDPVAVGAVTDNILSNAVKYSFPGGRILVKVWEEVTSTVCSVCDEGPGLSQEDQTKLFQCGVRLSAVPRGGEPSTGYGLAVAKELVDNLGGYFGMKVRWETALVSCSACLRIRNSSRRAGRNQSFTSGSKKIHLTCGKALLNSASTRLISSISSAALPCCCILPFTATISSVPS